MGPLLLESRAVIVAAHPDDEMIGLGCHLPGMRRLAAIVHVTDGAPRRGDDVQHAGCTRWEDYAALRREEFERALALSGGRSGRNICLQCPDQQASFRIAELARDLARLFAELSPDVVFTHAYEGGHPDHDATAAAVHAAARLAPEADISILEFASYHAGANGFECERFLEPQQGVLDAQPLSGEQREQKRAIFACYASQKGVLEQFPLEREPLRAAPEYDFSLPPHSGTLYYEHFDWGVTGAEWRVLATQAFRQLGLEPDLTSRWRDSTPRSRRRPDQC